jgi:hypothetical protein
MERTTYLETSQASTRPTAKFSGQKRSRPAQREKMNDSLGTQYDQWLDNAAKNTRVLYFLFKIDPLDQNEQTFREALVVIADRYNLLLDIDGTTLWVAKDNIVSVRPA